MRLLVEREYNLEEFMRIDFKDCETVLREKETLLKCINNRLDEERDTTKKMELEAELKLICAEIKTFLCDVYARRVFEVYNVKKPKLVRRLTKEVFTWDEAFGSDFSKIPASLRESLVGLVKGSGKYKFK